MHMHALACMHTLCHAHMRTRMRMHLHMRTNIRAKHSQVMLHKEPKKAFIKGPWVPPGTHHVLPFLCEHVLRTYELLRS